MEAQWRNQLATTKDIVADFGRMLEEVKAIIAAQQRKLEHLEVQIGMLHRVNGTLRGRVTVLEKNNRAFHRENGTLQTKISVLQEAFHAKTRYYDKKLAAQFATTTNHAKSIASLMKHHGRAQDVSLRGTLDKYREKLLQKLPKRRKKESKASWIKRMKAATQNSLDRFVLDEYHAVSGRIHELPSQDEAEEAMTRIHPSDKHRVDMYAALFAGLYPGRAN
ncbi:uncharacterized protein IUM83_03072 [Phytophthora cinnamomi]|uniref:uncharacterized protein n=1 Tax=Phytophthora cinnamomi TaxID=4785 RepID=UPI00355A8C3C|nr:hypothetical protein IUM83_03072 [Phytophthora cinnamomi]